MASRRQAQASAKKRDKIMPAPVEASTVEALSGTEESKTPVRTGLSEDDVLAEDFGALTQESSVFGGENKDGTLAEMQKGFAIDMKTKQSEVDEWNKQELVGENGKVFTTSSFLDITDAGKSYEAPFPGDPVWFPENSACMRLRFDQEDWTLRESDLLTSQKMTGLAMTFPLETKQWSGNYPGIATTRQDAHIIVHHIKLCKRTTTGLPYSCEVKFYTGTAQDSMLRVWHTDDPSGNTSGTFGTLSGTVVEPDENSRDEPVLLYHASMPHLTNPWMSRFMTFNFDKFRELLNSSMYLHPINKNYYKIKAPPLSATFKDFSPVQWLMFAFFRYLKFATKRQMNIDMGIDKDGFTATVGSTVIQSLYEPGSKPNAKPIGYQYVIYKPAFDKVIAAIEQKVRPATHMAKLDNIVLGLSLVGGDGTAARIEQKARAQRDFRDEFETNKLVGPCNFTAEIAYIAIPADYPELPRQMESQTGGKYHAQKKAKSGYGSYSYATALRA